MEKPKLSSNLQVALSSLAAVIVGHVLQFSFAAGLLADVPLPQVGMMVEGTGMVFGILFFPLLWWRHKAGYAGAIALGILRILTVVGGLSFGLAGEVIPEVMIPLVALAAISIVLIVSTAAAAREKA